MVLNNVLNGIDILLVLHSYISVEIYPFQNLIV